MKNINVETDLTINKKNLSQISSFLKRQSKEKTKNNHIEIGIVNSGTMQTIKVANKKSSDNKIEYDEKNQMILIQQDQIDKKYQKLEINLLQNDKKHLQENQIQQKQVNSNQLESQNQENFNQIDQVIQQKNPNISIIEDENNTDMQQIIILDCYQPLTEDQKSSQQLNKINQLQSSDEVTDNDTQENCNKIISEILEYKFEEFEKEDEQDQINLIYDDLSEIHYHVIQPIVNFRKWSEDKFKQSNQILSQNFIKNRDIIFKEIGDFNFLCKQFFSQDNMDLFVGYFQNNQGVICDYIYKIYYYKNTSDLLEEAEFITKYDKVKENEQCHIKISENVQILIMTKNTFLKLQSKSKQFQLLSFRYWNQEFFDSINFDKPFQLINLLKHSRQCQECLANTYCDETRNLRKFQLKQKNILDKLEGQGIFLCEYVNKGGEGVIFEGYKKYKSQYDDFIFKILFDMNEQGIKQEIEIMKLFEMNINVIKFIDFIQIKHNDLKIHVLILEKCKYSLADELIIFQKQKSFRKSQLFKIILDLLDGLIQLRIYSILHLDIKPGNILLSNQGNYVYTDFGLSSIKKYGLQIQVHGGTPYFESPEQKQLDPDIDFKSDIFSLGKTLQRVIEVFEKFSTDQCIQKFKKVIDDYMIQPGKISREDCLKIHELFLFTLLETNNLNEILDYYIQKIQNILELSSYDKNKDIPYILNLKLYYSLKLFYLFGIKISHNNYIKITTPFSINDSISPQITIQQNSIALNELDSNDLQLILTAILNISYNYLLNGEYQKSQQCYIETLQLAKQMFSNEYNLLTASVLQSLGDICQYLDDNKNALKYFLESLQLSLQVPKENEIRIAILLDSIGICYHDIGDKKIALEYILQSHQIRKQIFKENNIDIVDSLVNIGLCYLNLGDNKKALEYIVESDQLFQQIKNEYYLHPDCAIIQNNIGQGYQILGDQKKALRNYLESYYTLLQIFQKNSDYTIQLLYNISTCYYNIGDFKKAIKFNFKIIQSRKQKQKKNDPHIAASLEWVGKCYTNLGDNKKALEYQLQSFQMSKHLLLENYPNIANSLNKVGQCYFNLGDKKKALVYQLESLLIRKYIFKENHFDIAENLHEVGLSYLNLDDKKSLQYQLKSLQMFQQIYKENHPDIAMLLNDVGVCYSNLGNQEMALAYYLESLQMRKQIFKENHFDIIQSLNNLCIYYKSIGDYKQALECSLQSLQMCQQILKENDPNTAKQLENVGSCYIGLGDNKKAIQYQLESLQMRKQIFIQNHHDIASSLNQLGIYYKEVDDYKMALEYYLESVQIQKEVFEENKYLLVASLFDAGLCYTVLGDYKKALKYYLESLEVTKQIQQVYKKFNNDHQFIIGKLYKTLGDKKIALEYEQEYLFYL